MTVVLVGVFLGALGLADLARATRDVTTRVRRVTCASIGALSVLAGVLITRPGVVAGLILVALLGGAVWVWVFASSLAIESVDAGHRRIQRLLAFGSVGAGLLVALLGAQAIEQPTPLPEWLGLTVVAR